MNPQNTTQRLDWLIKPYQGIKIEDRGDGVHIM